MVLSSWRDISQFQGSRSSRWVGWKKAGVEDIRWTVKAIYTRFEIKRKLGLHQMCRHCCKSKTCLSSISARIRSPRPTRVQGKEKKKEFECSVRLASGTVTFSCNLFCLRVKSRVVFSATSKPYNIHQHYLLLWSRFAIWTRGTKPYRLYGGLLPDVKIESSEFALSKYPVDSRGGKPTKAQVLRPIIAKKGSSHVKD